jgi:hypothetical protein
MSPQAMVMGYMLIMRNIDTNYIIEDIISYILSSTNFDYLEFHGHIWDAVTENTAHLFLHMVKHGFRAGMSDGSPYKLLQEIETTNSDLIELRELVKSLFPEAAQPNFSTPFRNRVIYM